MMAAGNNDKLIRVVELFAGVGGFRIGLEGASDAYKTVWNNQWEPSTKRQDASLVYQARFGAEGHSNKDINSVRTDDIPDHDLLVGGFPCQDYSVAATLSKSGGIEGKKGVLWWQIYRILDEKGDRRPDYLFFENVDRLLNSPATQRGRDFAIILASLSDLGYVVEWRVINAADYGMPQRRRRTYIMGYKKGSAVERQISDAEEWIRYDGTMARAFPLTARVQDISSFTIDGTIKEVSDSFNSGKQKSPFKDAGIMVGRKVTTVNAGAVYDGPVQTLGSILVDESFVPEEFFISADELPQWRYEKGAKKISRISKNGHEYLYSEGGMAFPDDAGKPSRTIITGEGGAAPSRFKHVVQTRSGRYRRLLPIELERLNMFPDNHTLHPEVSDGRRAFLMGNALVCGVVERIGKSLYRAIYAEEPVSSRPICAARRNANIEPRHLFGSERQLGGKQAGQGLCLRPNEALAHRVCKARQPRVFLRHNPNKGVLYGQDTLIPLDHSTEQAVLFHALHKGSRRARHIPDPRGTHRQQGRGAQRQPRQGAAACLRP